MILNQISKNAIDRLILNMPNSVLIISDKKIGQKEVCDYIASKLNSQITDVYPEKDEKIDLLNGKIKTESIRRLYENTRSKSIQKQLFFIWNFETATETAQNAFLKLLEEPNENTYFILLADDTTNILSTILSRVTRTNILPLCKEESVSYIQSLGIKDERKQAQLLYLAEGYPEEIRKLATDQEYFEKTSQLVRDAKALVSGSIYSKLLITSSYKESREQSIKLVETVINMLKRDLFTNKNIESLKSISDLIQLRDKLIANGNIRLILTKISI